MVELRSQLAPSVKVQVQRLLLFVFPGFSNAVGIAMGEAHLASVFNVANFSIIDNYTFVFAGDGCLQEGIR